MCKQVIVLTNAANIEIMSNHRLSNIFALVNKRYRIEFVDRKDHLFTFIADSTIGPTRYLIRFVVLMGVRSILHYLRLSFHLGLKIIALFLLTIAGNLGF